jgi:pimeloyl-ACP methyl ester carboxylesterase
VPRSPLTHRTAAAFVVASLSLAACGDDPTTGGTSMHTTTSSTPAPRTDTVHAHGTTLHVERRGSGSPLLLVHGAGEDAAMLSAQADALAAAGFEVITYDRRGTGGSGGEDWPGGGAEQHAADAAALLEQLGMSSATVVGLSSGGVVALTMGARHGERVERVVAWEPPAVGVVPGGVEASAALMLPVDAHLAEHPDDYVGAQAILLSAILGFPVATDDPEFAATRANAETMIRDDASIPLATFTADELAGRDITIAVGSDPNDLVAGSAAALAALIGKPTTVATGPHEVYFSDPSVLVDVVRHAAGA